MRSTSVVLARQDSVLLCRRTDGEGQGAGEETWQPKAIESPSNALAETYDKVLSACGITRKVLR